MSNKNDTHRDGTFVATFFQAIDASMKHAITIIALLLPVTAWAEPLRLLPSTAWAQALPVPRQPGPDGGCPIG